MMRVRKTKTKRYLQQYQVDYIKEHGEILTAAQLATVLGVSQSTIWHWSKQLRVTPTKSFFQPKGLVIPACEEY